MGGRGAFFNKKTGQGRLIKKEFHTVATIRGIQVLNKNDESKAPGLPFMSGSPNRTYAVLNSKGELGSIGYYDEKKQMYKRVDFDKSHGGMKPHVNIVANGVTIGTRSLTPEELADGERIMKWKKNTTRRF